MRFCKSTIVVKYRKKWAGVSDISWARKRTSWACAAISPCIVVAQIVSQGYECAGIAEIAAGSIAMGLGGYLAGKTEIDHYNSELKREYREVEQVPEKEKEEVREFFENLGLSEDIQKQAVEEIAKDKQKWVDFMMKYELGLDKPDPKRATKSAMNIGLSYVVGGLVPLSPYFFINTPVEALKISVVVTLICLFIFGYFKSRMTGIHPWAGALRVMLIGAVAAGAAFGVAKIFQ